MSVRAGFKWADGKRTTVASECYARKHPDGTVERWTIETVRVRNTRRYTAAMGQYGARVVERWRVVRPRGTYYTLSQFFYSPGDWMHTNGQMVEGYGPWKNKSLRILRKRGLRPVTDTQLRAMMPASIR